MFESRALPVRKLAVQYRSAAITFCMIMQGSKRSRGKVSGLSGEPSAKVGKISTSPGGELSAMLDGGSSAAGRKGGGNTGELTLQGSMSIAVGTPREGGSQVGTPWEWTDEGMGLGMGMGMEMQTDADILAEFGDFGDFFEDDVLGFGEVRGCPAFGCDV